MKKFNEFLEDRCWPGYKPKPGKTPYSDGSCVKESAAAAIAAATAIAKKKSGNYDSEGMRKTPYKNPDSPNRKSNAERRAELKEDLRKWFSKTAPEGGWKRINSKGEAIGPCAREPGEPKPKCMSNEKRASLTKKERASAVRAKRKNDPNPERKGAPINVSNFGKGKISEDMENLNEKNVPTSPEKWAQAKSQAKAKFDVYPSAYANGWASKKYKEMGGGWKSVSEAKDEQEYGYEGDMALNQLKTLVRCAEMIEDMLKPNTDLPEWVQSKITLATDYIQTAADYMYSEMKEEVQIDELSNNLLGRYKTAAGADASKADKAGDYNKGNKRFGGILKATKKQFVNDLRKESVTSVTNHEDEPHEIIHKKTNKIVSTHKNYKDAYSAYEKLGRGPEGMTDHAIGHIEPPRKKMKEEVMQEREDDEYHTPTRHHVQVQVSKGDGPKEHRKATVRAKEPSHAVSAAISHYKQQGYTVHDHKYLGEETIQEGRPSQRHPLEGHEYHKKSDEALVHIAKDAHAAAEAMKSHNTDAENKYRDQANDSATVRHFRKTSGMPEWYKKKYGHMKEEIVNEVMDEPNYKNSIQARQAAADKSSTALSGLVAKKNLKQAEGKNKSQEFIDKMTSKVNAAKRLKEEDTTPPFDGPYKKATGTVTDKSGAKHTSMSKVRDLAKAALKRVQDNPSEYLKARNNGSSTANARARANAARLTESRKAEIIKDASKSAKLKASMAKDKFEADPVLSSEIVKEDK
jgi:hypothetical protein